MFSVQNWILMTPPSLEISWQTKKFEGAWTVKCKPWTERLATRVVKTFHFSSKYAPHGLRALEKSLVLQSLAPPAEYKALLSPEYPPKYTLNPLPKPKSGKKKNYEKYTKSGVFVHPAAKGGRQKGIGKKVTKNDKKVTQWLPKGDRKRKKCIPPFAARWTVIFSYFLYFGFGRGFGVYFVRAACLQNETAPEKLLNRHEKRFEKREKNDPKNDPKRVWKMFSPSRTAWKYFTGTFQQNFKGFSPPKICTKKVFFFHREALQGFSLTEDAMGGWKKEGGGKPHEGEKDTRSKKGFGPPRTVRFPPPSCVSALFFLHKNPRQSRPEALLEGSKNFRECAFYGTFSSPHTFCTPPYHGPRGSHANILGWLIWGSFGVLYCVEGRAEEIASLASETECWRPLRASKLAP